MPVDFESILADAKKRHEKKAAEEALAGSRDQERKRAEAQAGNEWLEENVRPGLQQARTAFEKIGLYATIGGDFDASQNAPFLAFYCAEPSVPRDFGGQVMSETLFIASDGKSVRVGYGDPGAKQPVRWSAPQPVASADIDRLLGEATRRVADSYYSRL